MNDANKPTTSAMAIKPVRFQNAVVTIAGNAPLVVHRFSHKIKEAFRAKMETGKAASSKKTREPQNLTDLFNDARYIGVSTENGKQTEWDGFNASAIRNAMISACRLVGFKMTLAKLSVFVVQDGWDKFEPQMPLVRINAKPVQQEDIARVETGQAYLTVRPAYHNWTADVKIRWDADQFTVEDIVNLMNRVGLQVGICEGRPDSKNSAGMGWGTFEVKGVKTIETKSVRAA